MSKVMGIFVKFWLFFDARSPNMVMSRDPRYKFRNCYFVLILHLILGKVTKFLVKRLSISEVISQKPRGREWKTPPPSAFKVKAAFTQDRICLEPVRNWDI